MFKAELIELLSKYVGTELSRRIVNKESISGLLTLFCSIYILLDANYLQNFEAIKVLVGAVSAGVGGFQLYRKDTVPVE